MTAPVELTDIVITGHQKDEPFLKKLKNSLVDAGMTVWYDHMFNEDKGNGQKKSQAILGCKIFAPVLSEHSAKMKSLHDELALAYISNSAIFPVGRSSFPEISSLLDVGSKLILARINWIFATTNEEYDENIKNLIQSMKRQLEVMPDTEATEDIGASNVIETHGMVLNTNQFLHTPGTYEREKTMDSPDTPDNIDFWDLYFPKKEEVKYTEFKQKFLEEYQERIAATFSEVRQRLFVNLMYQDVFHLKKTIKRSDYDNFCNKNQHADPHCFFNQMQKYVIAHISLRKVFDMESTLRITTIQNLGNFSFPAIIRGLSDMLMDEDPNIRAVAAIALAKAGKNRPDTVYKLVGILEDEDRLVRESACLSIGYLKASNAVNHVVDRWRNDPISTVREAASLALKRMNIEEAQECIKVTEVLSREMAALRP